MGAKKTKILLVVGALVLFVLLFISPKTESKPSADTHEQSSAQKGEAVNSSLEVYLNLAVNNLSLSEKKGLDQFRTKGQNDSLIVFWDRKKRPDLASYYLEEKAKKGGQVLDWEKAGNRYYYAVQFIQDQTEMPVLYQRAIFCFQKALALNPSNVEAKIMLASCYVEGTTDPMKGISSLKAIEKTDSNNLKLQLTFAFFSLKSGQLDKAIARFNKAVSIDSTYIEAYLHLADIYEKQNEKEKTISMLQKYASKTNDPTVKIEINKYIQQLKINN